MFSQIHGEQGPLRTGTLLTEITETVWNCSLCWLTGPDRIAQNLLSEQLASATVVHCLSFPALGFFFLLQCFQFTIHWLCFAKQGWQLVSEVPLITVTVRRGFHPLSVRALGIDIEIRPEWLNEHGCTSEITLPAHFCSCYLLRILGLQHEAGPFHGGMFVGRLDRRHVDTPGPVRCNQTHWVGWCVGMQQVPVDCYGASSFSRFLIFSPKRQNLDLLWKYADAQLIPAIQV